MTQPARALDRGTQLGAYRIVKLLGQGGMGAVYEARQEPLDRRVALKTLLPEYARHEEAMARFFNEAKVLSRLAHPSIVQVTDYGQSAEGTTYLVMEYLRGESLAGRLRSLSASNQRLPVLAALQIAWQVADTLAIAHAQSIIHRDIKPDNLMLVADAVAPGGERVKLLDFGLAKLTEPDGRGGLKTDTRAVMGTPLYMSPEQCVGAGGVDAKSDVYSLGCVLYEALSGQPPFVGDALARILAMHLYEPPPPLTRAVPKLPADVAELVHRLLIKEKINRPSMSEAADELGRLLAKLTSAAPPVRSRPPAVTDPAATRPPARADAFASTLGRSSGQRTVRRTPIRYIGLGLGGLAVLALTGLFIRSRTPSASTTPAPNPVVAAVPPRGAPVAAPSVVWRISTTPPGAAVLDEQGMAVGITPYRGEQPRGKGTTRLRVRREGYADETVTLDRGADADLQLSLSAVRPAAGKKQKGGSAKGGRRSLPKQWITD